jgi:DNA repair exonuclease SbcCD ATPase subunit
MQLKFKSITFSNILSFGALPTTIEFTSGLNLWSGKNGSGKSSALLDTLSFCLYGRPYRKIKIDEILNRKNKGNLKTSCMFSIGSDEYTLTRNKEPDKLEIIKNGNTLELLSSKKLNQFEIDRLLGINYEIFKQVISISISYNKPFLELDSKDKRKTVEQMFGLSEFGKMNKVLQEKSKVSNKLHDLLENNITNIEGTIRILQGQILDLEEQNRNFDRLQKEKIEKCNNQLESEKTLLESSIKEASPYKIIIEKLQAEIKDHNKSKYLIGKSKLEKERSEHEWNVRSLTTQINKLTTEKFCPICKKQFDENLRQAEISQKTSSKEQSEKLLLDSIEKIKQVSDNIEFIEKKESNLSKQLIDLREIEIDIRDHQKDIRNLESQIIELQNSKNTIDVEKVKEEVKIKISDLAENKSKLLEETIKIKNYAIADRILSDSGVKSYVVEKMIPIINHKIFEYLEYFELPIKISFNKNMDEKIIDIEHYRQEVNYWSFSEGEKKRISFSIMFALLDTMKIISSWFSDLLIIDELLDSAADDECLDKMLEIMKKISDEKGLNIYIISHKINNNFSSTFNKHMLVSKNINGFSEITEEK